MASGKTHDWTTWALLPAVWLISRHGFALTQTISLLIMAGVLVGGLLLSPDLDIRSRPFYRWGWLRFIWWPYQWTFKHRSSWTHGLWIAPWLRLIYLTSALTLLYVGGSWLLQQQFGIQSTQSPQHQVQQMLKNHMNDILWLGVGIWIGSLLHVTLDWLSSSVKALCTPRRKP